MVDNMEDDVWKLETSVEEFASESLSEICEDALKGNKKAQRYLRKVWDNEKWSSIKQKLKDINEIGGSIWYVWWMDGVRNHIYLSRKKYKW